MAKPLAAEAARTPIGLRRPARGLKETFLGVTRQNFGPQMLAGVTLLAIAIPEQLATSQLAGVPAFVAMIAFITATLVFVVVRIEPDRLGRCRLDDCAALRGRARASRAGLDAAVHGVGRGDGRHHRIAVLAVGLFKLGWIADFLSVPIVTGFLCGIGVIIIVHQLPSALGVPRVARALSSVSIPTSPARSRECVVDRDRARDTRGAGGGREGQRARAVGARGDRSSRSFSPLPSISCTTA